jgi:hypothetical protein
MPSSLKQYKASMEERETQKTKKNRWKKPGLHKSSNSRDIGFETSAKSHQRKFASNISPSSQATYTKEKKKMTTTLDLNRSKASSFTHKKDHSDDYDMTPRISNLQVYI